MPKMTVLCLKDTGHVLAAVTEPPSGPPKLESVVGDAFLLRNTIGANPNLGDDAIFSLPPSMLEVKSVPLDTRAIAHPQSFVVNGGIVVQVSTTGTASTFSAIDGTGATFDFGANVAADTKVVALLRADSDARVQRSQSGVILAGKSTVGLNHTIVPGGPPASLASDTYWSALAAAGKPIAYEIDAVP